MVPGAASKATAGCRSTRVRAEMERAMLRRVWLRRRRCSWSWACSCVNRTSMALNAASPSCACCAAWAAARRRASTCAVTAPVCRVNFFCRARPSRIEVSVRCISFCTSTRVPAATAPPMPATANRPGQSRQRKTRCVRNTAMLNLAGPFGRGARGAIRPSFVSVGPSPSGPAPWVPNQTNCRRAGLPGQIAG